MWKPGEEMCAHDRNPKLKNGLICQFYWLLDDFPVLVIFIANDSFQHLKPFYRRDPILPRRNINLAKDALLLHVHKLVLETALRKMSNWLDQTFNRPE